MDGATTGGPDRRIGWLGSPPGATWPGPDDGPAEGVNPFVAFRTLLWSHHAALAAGGRTIAVMATGVNRIYPPEHTELAETISRFGAILTEARLDQGPLPGLFPQRNRIISGLSVAVVVIEAGRRSGRRVRRCGRWARRTTTS